MRQLAPDLEERREPHGGGLADPDHDPGYLPLLPRSNFTMWRGGGTAPAWAGAPGVPLNVAWRSTGPGPAAGTGASSFVLTARTVTLTFAMSAAERSECEDTMRGWYAETW